MKWIKQHISLVCTTLIACISLSPITSLHAYEPRIEGNRFIWRHGSTLSHATAAASLIGGLGYLAWDIGKKFFKDEEQNKKLAPDAIDILAKKKSRLQRWLPWIKRGAAAFAAVAGVGYLALSRLKSIDYDPNIRFVNGNPKQNSPIAVFFHGYGANRKQVGSEIRVKVLPEGMPVATFDFPDTQSLPATNFGEQDGLLVCYVLHTLNKLYQPSKFHLQALSRGCAAAGNAIKMLSEDRYKPLLAKVGINDGARKDLLTKINKGSLVLNVPLCDARAAINRQIPIIPSWIKQGFMWLTSRYKLGNEWNIANHPPQVPKTFVYLEKGDTLVGNKAQNQKFVSGLGPGTWVVEGSDGGRIGNGHMHHHEGGTTFSNALNEWRSDVGIPTS